MLYHQSGYAPEWMAQREENMIARRSVSAAATVLIVLLLASCMTADKVDELVSAQVSQMQANIIMLVEQTARSMVKQEVETTVAEVLKRMQAIEAQYSTIVAANATLKEEVGAISTEAMARLERISADYDKILGVFIAIANANAVSSGAK